MRRALLCCLLLACALPAVARDVQPDRGPAGVLLVDGSGSDFFPSLLDDLLGPDGWDGIDLTAEPLPEFDGELLALLRTYRVVVWRTGPSAARLVERHEMVNRYVNPITPEIQPGRLLLSTTDLRLLPPSFQIEVVGAQPDLLPEFSVRAGLQAFPFRPELTDLTSLDDLLARAVSITPLEGTEELYRLEYCVRCYSARPPYDPVVAVRWPPYEAAAPTCRVTTLSFEPDHFSGAVEAVRRVLVYEMGVRDYDEVSANAGEMALAVGNAGYLGNFFSGLYEPSCRYPASGFIEHLYNGGLWVGARAPDGARRVSTAAFSASTLTEADETREYRWIEGSNETWSDIPSSPDYDPRALADSHLTVRYRDDVELESGAHVPLGLHVRQEALSWALPDYGHGTVLSYTLRNDSAGALQDVWAGLWMDTTVGNVLENDPYDPYSPSTWNYYDDANGALRPGDGPDDPGLWMMWERDDDGDDGEAPTWVGTVWLGASAELPTTTYRQWRYRRDPATDDDAVDPDSGEILEGRYAALSSGGWDVGGDFDLVTDWNGLLGAGPHPALAPGDSLRVDFAVVCGVDSLHLVANAVRLRDLYLRGYRIVATELGGLWAERDGAAVNLRWALLAGEDALGVHVWRGDLRLTEALLPPDGARFEDPAAPPGALEYRLQLVRSDGAAAWLGSVSVGAATPAAPRLERAVPNPFNPSTEIRWSQPAPGPATVAVFDLRGRRLAVLAEGEHAAGAHAVTWDGRADDGRALPSGAYVARLETGEGVSTLRLQLVR